MSERIDANTTSARFAGTRPQPDPAAEKAWEETVREALSRIEAPEDAKAATLRAIESLRAQQDAAAPIAAHASDPSPRRMRGVKIVRRALAAAACVIVVAAGAVGFRIFNEPAAYIGVDVNPSLELTVNAFGTVLDARALNGDAEAALEGVSVKNLGYEEALAKILESEGMSPYVEGDSYIEISVTSEDDALAETLQKGSSACLSSLGCEGACSRIDAQTRDAAHHAGMGAGKYAEAQKLIALDPTVSLDECADMTMREIRDRIDACSGEDAHGKASQGSSEAGQGARHGVESGHQHAASEGEDRGGHRRNQGE